MDFNDSGKKRNRRTIYSNDDFSQYRNNPDYAYFNAIVQESQVDAVHKMLMFRYKDSSFKGVALKRAAEKILELFDIRILQRLEQQDLELNFAGKIPYRGFEWLKQACKQVKRDYFADENEKAEINKTFDLEFEGLMAQND